LLDDPAHRCIQALVRELNRLYRSRPALHALDCESGGFEWIEANDAEHSVLAFLRRDRAGAALLVGCNLTPVPRHDYRVRLPGAGRFYGWRAYGPHAPGRGHRFNPSKLLLDPCAREIVGRFDWRDEHYGYPRGHPDEHFALDLRDNARWALKSRVAAPLPPRE